MPRPKSQKMEQAIALLQTMPKAKLGEFVTAFEKAHSIPISQPVVFLAKKHAGLTRSHKKAKGPEGTISVEQMQKIKEMAKQHGGIKEIRKQLAKLKTIADEAGGFEQLEQCFDILEELKRK